MFFIKILTLLLPILISTFLLLMIVHQFEPMLMLVIITSFDFIEHAITVKLVDFIAIVQPIVGLEQLQLQVSYFILPIHLVIFHINHHLLVQIQILNALLLLVYYQI